MTAFNGYSGMSRAASWSAISARRMNAVNARSINPRDSSPILKLKLPEFQLCLGTLEKPKNTAAGPPRITLQTASIATDRTTPNRFSVLHEITR